MKDQNPQDVVAQEVDANAVDALSAELAASIESQEDKSTELNALLDEKKEREEESVDVAAADDGLAAMILADTNAKGESIPAAEASSTGGAAGIAGLSTTDTVIYAGVAALGVAGIVAASEDDNGDGVPADYVPPNTSGANGGAENIWTLQDRVEITPGSEAVPASQEVYWGYNPHAHDEAFTSIDDQGTANTNDDVVTTTQPSTNEGPLDGGIPVADLIEFLQGITGLDLAELGLIDDDGEGPFDNVRDLSISNVLNDNDGSGGGSTLSVTLADGSVVTAEAAISGQYFDFLNGLLFDDEGNSRLFLKDIDAKAAGPDLEEALGPIVLTTALNNGGTIESGKPDTENDLVVAGRLELLHEAYIDAGDGYNVLEVDAKGVYAQPIALTNIQEVRVQNLPNFYTEEGNSNSDYSSYPDLASVQGEINSILDLSRAIDIEKVVVTEGYATTAAAPTYALGDLTVVGVRNGADLAFEGGFSQDVTVHYGQGLQDSLNVDLRVGDVNSSLNVLHNLAVINVNSLGIENNMDNFFAGGDISRMFITGSAALGIEGNIVSSFNANRPAVIDASANTGGVDLTLEDTPFVAGQSATTDDPAIPAIPAVSVEAIVFTGSTANDDVDLGAERVTVTTGAGDNHHDIDAEIANVNAGDGNNIIHVGVDSAPVYSLDSATIVAGNGDNNIEVVAVARGQSAANPAADASSNVVTQSEVTITAGNGANDINVVGDIVSVTTGSGDDEVTATGIEISVSTGAGDDVVTLFGDDSFAGAGAKSVLGAVTATLATTQQYVYDSTSGGSWTLVPGSDSHTLTDDTASVVGITAINGSLVVTYDDAATQLALLGTPSNDTVAEVLVSGLLSGAALDFGTSFDDGVLMNVDLSSGTNTLVLGGEVVSILQSSGGVTALEGSSISGSGVTIFVDVSSDLRAADLSGLVGSTKVVLDDASQGEANAATITLTAAQFIALGADAFSVVNGSAFNANANINIIVTEDTDVADLLVGGLDSHLCLSFEIASNATLTLTAEQLHNNVATDGIILAPGSNGTVVLNNVGQDFNPFADDDSNGLANGTLFGSFTTGDDLIVNRVDGGFERPEPADPVDQLILTNADQTNPQAVGDIDLSGNGSQTDLILNGGGAFSFSSPVLLPENFLLDFSDTSSVSGLTIGNFQNITVGTDKAEWGEIVGNGVADQRIDIQLEDNSVVGDASDVVHGGFVSSGVSIYVVTDVYPDGSASPTAPEVVSIAVCDSTAGVEVLGLQGNWDTTVTYHNVNYSTSLLLEGDGVANGADQPKANGDPDFSSIGVLSANFFVEGGAAVVNINNQGVALGVASDGVSPRAIEVQGLDIDKAESVAINITDGPAVIDLLSGDTAESVTITSADDVVVGLMDVGQAVTASNLPLLEDIDASGVAGDFTLYVGGTSDFTDISLVGVDAIVVADAGTGSATTITLTAAQIEDIGLANITAETGLGTTTLNVANLSDELIDLSSAVTGSGFDAVGTVTILDVNGTVTLNAGTNLSGATTVTIDAQTSDTTAEMSTAQFNQIAGATPDVEAAIGTNAVTGSPYVATMVLTGAQAEDVLDLTEVGDLSGGTPPSLVDVILRLDGVTAGEDFSVFGHAVTLEVASGVNDLSATDDVFINGLPNTGTVDGVGVVSVGSVVLTGGELTLTAGQLAAIIANNTGTIEETFAGSTGGTLNITEFAAQAFDLDELEALGINIGTITLLDSNVPIAINAATTFGDADEIVTPTADQNDSTAFADTVNGLEPTTLTMTVAQFLSSAGIISGDSEVDLTGLTNNVDSDGDFVVDQTEVDLSGIANAGTLTFATDTDGATVVSHVITLTSTANLGGFALELANGELIRYATETQAAAVVNEAAAVTTATGIQWLFTSVTGPVDTSGYDGDINHLFIDEALLASQPREEDLWTNLEGTIFVEKVNGATIPEFYKYDRVNTFEAFTSLPGGVNYDDAEDFSTIGSLLINLEGEVNIASILVGDTNNGNGSTPNVDGKGYFSSLVINSYEDLSTAEGYNPTAGSVSGRIVEANYIGDISLNVGSVDELVDITISTYGTDSAGATTTTADDQYSDPINVNGAQDDRDGLAIEVGTITFDALASTTFTTGQTPADATLTLRGANDITIAGVDISDSEVNLLFIDANEHSASLEIGGIAPVGGLNGFGEIYVANGFSGLGTIGDSADTAGLVDLLVIDGGDNDFTDAALDIENLHVTGDATITLTATQVIAITSANFSVDAGVTVTLNVTELGATLLDLNTIQDAGFNIGVVSTVEDNGSGAVSTVLNDNTTLGGADELRVLLNDEDNSLTLTATQYLQLNGGNITELDSDATDVNSAAVTITDVSTSSNAVDISNPNGDDRVSVNLDLSTVATTGAHLLDIADTNVAADVTIDSASDLSDFSVSLDDIDDDNQTGTAAGGTIGDETPNELSGQTVRFTNEVQAGRDILVEGYDPGAVEGSTSGGGTVGNLLDSEADTNVVWDFDSVTGPIQTSGYDFELGRLWVSDVLVASDNDLEDLFSASDVDGNSLEDDINLNGSIIVRIVNTQSLDSFNDDSIGFSRFVEVEAFTDISATGLVFDEQDQLVDVRNLTIDLGGEVSLGNLELGNVLAAANVTPNTDEFGVLTINSFLATNSDHYLMPEDFVDGTNVPPSGGNVIGDISAAVNRQELDQVVINATDVELTINTIFFSDDGDSSDSGIATLTLSGDNTVTIKSLDISDAEITNVVIDNNLTPSTLYVTGGSPGVDGGDTSQNTEVLSIASGGVTGVGEIQTVELSGAVLADGTVTFMGTDIAVLAADTLDDVGAAIAAADVAIQANNPDLAAGTSAVAYNATTNTLTVTFLAAAGNVATLVTATDNGIIFDDGVITQESTTPSTIFGSTVGGTTYAGVSGGELSEIVITENGRVELGVIALVDTLEFSIDAAATAYVTATLGEADANGLQAPDLADGGTWVIDNVDELTVDGSTDFGAGSLSITGSSITLTGDVDFTALLALTVSVGTSILLTDGATFRLTAEQIDYLNDQGVTIEKGDLATGQVIVEVSGDMTGGTELVTNDLDLAQVDELVLVGDTTLSQAQLLGVLSPDMDFVNTGVVTKGAFALTLLPVEDTTSPVIESSGVAGDPLNGDVTDGGLSQYDLSMVDVITPYDDNALTLSVAQTALLTAEDSVGVPDYLYVLNVNDSYANITDDANEALILGLDGVYTISDINDLGDLGAISAVDAALLVGADNYDEAGSGDGTAPTFTVTDTWANWVALIASAEGGDAGAISAITAAIASDFVFDISDIDTASFAGISVAAAAILSGADSFVVATHTYDVDDNADNAFDATGTGAYLDEYGAATSTLLAAATGVRLEELTVAEQGVADGVATLTAYTLLDTFVALVAGSVTVYDARTESHAITDFDGADYDDLAGAVGVAGADPALTPAEAAIFAGASNYAAEGGDFDVSGAPTDYFVGGSAVFEEGVEAALNLAQDITITGQLTALQAFNLVDDVTTNSGNKTYSITDTADDIFDMISIGANFSEADSITHTGLGEAANGTATGTVGVVDTFVYGALTDTTTIAGFEVTGVDDIFDFSAVPGSLTLDTAIYDSSDLADVLIDSKLAYYSEGTETLIDTAAGIATLIETGSAIELSSAASAILITGDAGSADDAANIWYIDDTVDAVNGTITAADVMLVGTMASFDLDTLTVDNFTL